MVAGSALIQSVLCFNAAQNLTSLFGPHLSAQSEILNPTDENFYGNLRQRWTSYHAPRYGLGAIKPATVLDVQNIVRTAVENDIPFFVSGGGHGISDYATFDGLSIELSKFNTIDTTSKKDRIIVGGSVKIYELIEPLAKLGKELPLGSCACVGVIGATLGGGIGGLHGRHGILADLVEEFEVVTASGDLVQASASKNPELFWGLRGAGSNFGIVTSATFKLPDVSNKGMYVNADFLYPVKSNHSFWNVMADFDNTMPSRLAITAVAVFNRVTNEPIIAVNAIYYGTIEEANPYLQPFLSLGPQMSNISSVPADEILDAAFFNSFGQDNGACTPNQHINIYTAALKQFHAPTFESVFQKLVDFWYKNPDYQGRLLMQRYSNQGPMRTPDDVTAFALRDTKLYLNIEGFYPNSTLDDAVNEFAGSAQKEFANTSGYEQLSVYSNYARGHEGASSWYGERKLPRLAALKRKWDPEQRLSVNNPVPLHWP